MASGIPPIIYQAAEPAEFRVVKEVKEGRPSYRIYFEALSIAFAEEVTEEKAALIARNYLKFYQHYGNRFEVGRQLHMRVQSLLKLATGVIVQDFADSLRLFERTVRGKVETYFELE